MSGKNADIAVKFGVEGEDAVARAIGKVRQESDRTSAPMVDDLPQLRDVAATIGKIGLATAAIGGAGLAAFSAALGKSKEIATDVAGELQALHDGANKLGSVSANNLGGFAFAVKAGGLNGLSDVMSLGESLLDVARKVRDYDEATVEALHNIGSEYQDLFEFDPDELRWSGRSLGADDMLLATINRLQMAGTTVDEVMEKFTPLIGRSGAAQIAGLLEAGSDQLEGLIDYYDLLANIQEDDYAAAFAFQRSMEVREAAIFGLKMAFARELYPTLTESNQKFADFAIANRDRIGLLGQAFADFNGVVGSLFSEIGEQILNVVSGSEISEDTPLTRWMERVVELAVALKNGLIDVMDYMTTGETDAPWLQSTLSFFEELSQITTQVMAELAEFGGVLKEKVWPHLKAFIEWSNKMLESLTGIDNYFATGAIIAGLVLFSGTIATVAGSVLTLTAGVLKLSGGLAGLVTRLGLLSGAGRLAAGGVGALGAGLATAARTGFISAGLGVDGYLSRMGASSVVAGGAGVAAGSLVGGAIALAPGATAGWLAKSSADLEAGFEVVSARAEEIAAEHGQAAAAAYMQAFLDNRPDEQTGFKVANWMAGLVGMDVDLDGARDDLNKIMEGADPSLLAAGYAQGMREFGWSVDPSGTVQIGAELTVSGVDLDAAGRQSLSDMLLVSGLSAEMSDAINPQIPDIGAEMERALRDAGVTPTAAQTPVIIQIPSGEEIPGFSGSPDAISQLSRATSAATRARS
ncbi:hypothetical protein LOS78_12785 [Paracoccus sp. MA]|uniref:hypothetical protein n=1 Tax=Paracoccus sp. MA TaxID=2895796 RepID=UPI001E4CBCB7|nr:hypothetical protein [Paracoccus sp. MA]UFM66802.1 hypothetical protein LOS78_12785 [Paracoccus sp. MA]